MRLMPEMLVQERYWHELDKEAVGRQYGGSFDGVRAYIEEHITDTHQQSVALAKLKAIRGLVPVAFLPIAQKCTLTCYQNSLLKVKGYKRPKIL